MTKITRLTNSKLSQQKQVVALPLWQNTIVINLIMIGLLLIGGAAYLVIVNSTAAESFTVSALNHDINQTKANNQKMELEISEVLALPHVSDMSERYHLVAAGSVHYLDDTSAVAFSQ
ncbi:MAG: hypothetical protein WCV88_01220 [Patescibacteria group bacterium]